MSEYSIDEINAASQIIDLMKKDNGFDDAFHIIANKFDLTAKEMENVQTLIEQQ